MFSYMFYKVTHIIGIMMLFFGMGGLLLAYATAEKQLKSKIKMIGFLAHGLGLLFILVGGFGMAARLGLVSGLPPWIHFKLAVWVLFGLAISLLKRKSQWTSSLFIVTILLGSAAAFVATYKPF